MEQGQSGGGNSFGYDVLKKLDAQGELIRGSRSINEREAGIVRRIFREYTAGKSTRRLRGN